MNDLAAGLLTGFAAGLGVLFIADICLAPDKHSEEAAG